MRKPNIFNFATSELSHDAFIAWLLSWADPKFKEESLHQLSKSVLNKFFELAGIDNNEIQSVDVKRQYKYIDVLLIIKTVTGMRLAVIVENKIYTKEHSDQLNRYRNELHSDNDLDDISDKQIIGIYFKMWEQSNMRNVNASDFAHFGRKTMLNLLKKYNTGSSDIVNDYERYIGNIQENLDSFQSISVNDWKNDQWIGFYSKLKKELKDGDFDYVPNPRGGFMGFWYGSRDIGNGDSLYVQSEEGRLCFKVNINKEEDRQQAKWYWHELVVRAGKMVRLEILKPKVMRVGRWFTIGVLKVDKENPWVATNEDGIIQFKETVELAKLAGEVIDLATKTSLENT